ncbi:hypothetical protein T05_4188 [Trichinella murrelli]|uniref:Uncharacterized protein n=1 Tax=Trichinella murrelli TaxID=144512 RepID=A0A0V0TPF1_9BILA|nr:hypothetical protein T05_4188 [Trichinella murrelli]
MNDCCQFVCYAYGSLIGRLCIFGRSSEEEIVAMETILVKRLPHQRFALGECNAWIKKDVAQNQIQDLSEIIPNGEMCNSCIHVMCIDTDNDWLLATHQRIVYSQRQKYGIAKNILKSAITCSQSFAISWRKTLTSNIAVMNIVA